METDSYCGIAILLENIVVLWYCNIVVLLYCNIVVLWYCGIVVLQYCGIVVLQYCGKLLWYYTKASKFATKKEFVTKNNTK